MRSLGTRPAIHGVGSGESAPWVAAEDEVAERARAHSYYSTKNRFDQIKYAGTENIISLAVDVLAVICSLPFFCMIVPTE